MEEIKQRRIELDIARAFAIICVVICHATETIYSVNKDGWNSLSNPSRIFMTCFFVLGRLGVPIFLFLTGTLILRKKFDTDNDVIRFYKNKLKPLIIVYFIWIIIYNIFFWINNQQELVTCKSVIKEIFFLEKIPLDNMWYLPMIICLYLGLPFVSKILKTFSKKTIRVLIAIIFVCGFIIPMINTTLNMFGINNSCNSILNISFLGGIYGIYVIMGYYLDNIKCKKRKIWISIAILCYILTCIFQLFSYTKASKSIYNVWYSFPLLLIGAAYIYKLILSINTSKINKKLASIFTFISKTSLTTFFLHIIIINVLAKNIEEWQIIMPMKVIALAIITFGTCMLSNFILTRIKIIKKYVMLIK